MFAAPGELAVQRKRCKYEQPVVIKARLPTCRIWDLLGIDESFGGLNTLR